jgi:hypothetical protein
MVCTETIAEGFWPPYVERRTHGQGRLCWVSHPLTEHRLA